MNVDFHFHEWARIIRPMNRERVKLSGEELRRVMQEHYRAFVTGVRAEVLPSGEVALEVDFAQRPLQLELARVKRH